MRAQAAWYTVISPRLILSNPWRTVTNLPRPNSSAPENVLTTKIDPTSARFEANMRFLADLMSQVRNEGEKICEGGGAKAIENQHAKGRLTARERIAIARRSGNILRTWVFMPHTACTRNGAARRRRA